MFQVSFNQDGKVLLLNIKHGNLFSHYYTILINKVTMTREICQGITLIMKNRAKNRAKIRSNKMASLKDARLCCCCCCFFGFLSLTFEEMNFEHDAYFNWSQWTLLWFRSRCFRLLAYSLCNRYDAQGHRMYFAN